MDSGGPSGVGGRIALEPGDVVLARYEILREVGRGGMGVVYAAKHKELDKPVAIKLSLPGIAVERFRREAQLLAKISSPYVVAVHDYDVASSGAPILVMEWIDGRDLHSILKEASGPLPEEQVRIWMTQVCQGMQAAAERDIVHRDLKPSNVLIDSAGRARVADFGLARVVRQESGVTRAHTMMGSPHYMAPEQADDAMRVDARADVYSFGATFYHAATGSPPFPGGSALELAFKHKTEPLISPKARNAQLSDLLNDVLERCMAKRPEQRFASFTEVQALLTGGPVTNAWDAPQDKNLAPHLERYRSRKAAYLDRGAEIDDVYEVARGRRLRVMTGTITTQDVEAIVSCDDDVLTMSGGVSAAIRKAAGPQVFQELRRYVVVQPGRAVVTSAGNLMPRYVVHAITLGKRGASVRPSRDLIIQLMGSCLYHAVTLEVTTMAFPLLGTGTGGFSPEVCLDTMFQYLARQLANGTTLLHEIRLVLFRK